MNLEKQDSDRHKVETAAHEQEQTGPQQLFIKRFVL